MSLILEGHFTANCVISGWLNSYKSLDITFPSSFPLLPSSAISQAHSTFFFRCLVPPPKDKPLAPHGLQLLPLLVSKSCHKYKRLVPSSKDMPPAARSLRLSLLLTSKPLHRHKCRTLTLLSKDKLLAARGHRPSPLLMSPPRHKRDAGLQELKNICGMSLMSEAYMLRN